MCRDCGVRPRTVDEFRTWYQRIFPDSNIDYSIISDENLRIVSNVLPIRCLICGYDSRISRSGGQSYRNIWYSHRPCGGCARNVSREPVYWQAEAQALYDADEITDNLEEFLPSSSRVRVELTCDNCGEPYAKNLREMRVRTGHRSCRNPRRRTRAQFIRRAESIHAWRLENNDGFFPFVYDRVPDFPVQRCRIEIGCLRCPDNPAEPYYFTQLPDEHLNGYDGCENCQRRQNWSWDDLDLFFAEHPNSEIQPDWTLIDRGSICNGLQQVPVQCGEGHQRTKLLSNIVSHESGLNCPPCSHIRLGLLRRTTRERFIQTAEDRHIDDDGNRLYGYGRIPQLMVYQDEVEIYCFECEVYYPQLVMNHLSGCGHRTCNPGGFNLEIPAVMYQLSISIDGEHRYWKIGITNHSAQERADDIRQSIGRLGYRGEVLVVQEWQFDTGQEALNMENAIHHLRITDQLDPDDFIPPQDQRFEGWTELFPPDYDPRDAMLLHQIDL